MRACSPVKSILHSIPSVSYTHLDVYKRQDFILHPENLHLRPGESYVISWELFWFQGKKEFEEIAGSCPGFVTIHADHFLVLGKEPISFRASFGRGWLTDSPGLSLIHI